MTMREEQYVGTFWQLFLQRLNMLPAQKAINSDKFGIQEVCHVKRYFSQNKREDELLENILTFTK